MKPRRREPVELSREAVERGARILGAESAFAKMLADADRRGVPCLFVHAGNAFFVVEAEPVERRLQNGGA